MNLANRLFNAEGKGIPKAETALKALLLSLGINCTKTGWDHYDASLELREMAPAFRLTPTQTKAFFEAGFIKVYVNHTDKWETHYGSSGSKGWRVSYPHVRGPQEKGIWVEEIAESWPKEWFETGYAVVKAVEPNA